MKSMKGFIALTSVLVLSAILLSITISVASRSISTAEISTGNSAKHKARILARSCAEHALVELQRTLNYSGNESLTIDGESCDILSISGTGNTNRVIQAKSEVFGYIQKLEIMVSEVSPDVTITSWDEVTSF